MKTMRFYRYLVLAGASALALNGASPAFSQTAANQRSYNIPAGSLAQAADAFSAQSGLKVTIRVPDAGAVRVSGVSGAYDDQEAFSRLLSGSGLSWHREGDTIVVDGSVAQSQPGDRMLSSVRVEGAEGAFAAPGSFGPNVGANGSSDAGATEGTRSLTTNGSSVSTKTPMTLKETPQSVAVVTAEQIRQQNMTNMLAALQSTPGITLTPDNGRNLTHIYSRGYEVNTFIIDGGAPSTFTSGTLAPDLSQYDRVEVLKGSSGLFGGAGTPGGVVNLQRKRPLDHQQMVFTGQLGSWDYSRAEADLSSPLAFNGDLRGRLDVVYQDNDFFYDVAHQETWNLYGILEASIGENTSVRAGGSYRDVDGRGDNVFGVPRFANGDDTHLPRSTNFTTPWARSHDGKDEAFFGLEHRFDNDWKFEATGTRTEQRSKSFAPGFSAFDITQEGDGFSYNAAVDNRSKTIEYSLDAHVTGDVELWGLSQKFLIGADYQHYDQQFSSVGERDPAPVNIFDPQLERFAQEPAKPDPANSPVGGTIQSNSVLTRQTGVYANLMLEPVKGLHLNGGVRLSDYKQSQPSAYVFYLGGMSFSGESEPVSEADNVVTFAGSAVYELTSKISAYASFADIYQPTTATVTAEGDLLPPLRGETFEAGLKGAFADGKLNASLAVFSADQRNVAIYGTITPTSPPNCCYTPDGRQKNRGVELQVSGELAPGWQVNAGYTYLKVDYNQAYWDQLSVFNNFASSSTQQPKNQVKIYTTYVPTWAPKVTLLANFRYDSDRSTVGTACPVAIPIGSSFCPDFPTPYAFVQKAYALGDLGIEYRPVDRWSVGLNVTNITDKRYYATSNATIGNGSFYGEPRRVVVSLRATY